MRAINALEEDNSAWAEYASRQTPVRLDNNDAEERKA
jgi:hypothetical protein